MTVFIRKVYWLQLLWKSLLSAWTTSTSGTCPLKSISTLTSPSLTFPRPRNIYLTRKTGLKSFVMKADNRKMTPTPEVKNKYQATPKIYKNTEERGRSLGQESRDQKQNKSITVPNNLPLINPMKKLELLRPSSSKTRILNVGVDKDKEMIYDKYRYIVRSQKIPKERVLNYLILCIRGLHYSTQCLKEPSKKFINSRKLKIPTTPQSRRSIISS